MHNGLAHNFYEIGRILKEDSRFSLPEHLEEWVVQFVEYHAKEHGEKIQPQSIYYRARINAPGQRAAYLAKEMLAPPKEIVRSGRINPEGIPYLYLADSIETALYEVRPWVGALVSIGEFHISEPLVIANLAVDEGVGKYDGKGPETLAERVRGNLIRQIYFSTPVHASDKFAYLASQYIAEKFKLMKLDGLLYKSSLKQEGKNLVLFSPEAAKPGKVQLQEVESVHYSSKVK